MPKAIVDAIEAAVGIMQLLGVALLEGHTIVEPLLDRALGADAEHLGIDVADRDARAGPAGFRHAEGNVAGAAGEIEQRKRQRHPWAD